MITTVVLTKDARRDLHKVPRYIQAKLDAWIESVELIGLENVRKIPGFHDEPLLGQRFGQRSIRLNRAYRAIYIVVNNSVSFVQIEEVHKHGY